MTSFIPRTMTTTTLSVGLGIGLSLSMNSASPLRSAFSPLRCEYTSPYYRTEPTTVERGTGWTVHEDDPLLQKQGRTSNTSVRNSKRWLTPKRMRQISLGSVLGLVAGVGLRAVSRVLAVSLGIGIVVVEVCGFVLYEVYVFVWNLNFVMLLLTLYPHSLLHQRVIVLSR